jgi:hypothetical protein
MKNHIYTRPAKANKAVTFILVTTLICSSVFAYPGSKSRKMGPKVTSDAVVLEWNEIAYKAVGTQPPFPQARAMAIVQVAVFEAVNAISNRYEPYLGGISASPDASTEAAAIVAAHDVLVSLVPAQAGNFDTRRDASLAVIPDGQSKTDGISVGAAAAAAVLADRSTDGAMPLAFYMPTTSAPYEWQTYAGCPAGGGAWFHWRDVTPFGIESSSQFRADPPPSLGSGVYGQDYNEVKRVGDRNASLEDRPKDRADVALLYAVTGLDLWNGILAQIARTRNDDISKTSRNLAVMNMAVMDASLSVFDSKYFYKTWRPVTAIPRADEDGNKWTRPGPYLQFIAATPCFPSYPSAHGTLSGAARTVLERAYGRFGHDVTVSHTNAPGIVLHYTDLRVITDDIADARVYGGIHFRFDQDAGERQGHAVGQYVYNNKLQKVAK